MRIILIFLAVLLSDGIIAQTRSEDEKSIRAVMAKQQEAWSNYDLEGFMEGYWKNDSLKFFGSNGITYGWDQTLANYKRGYSNKEVAGTLNFTLESITPIEEGSYYVMGRFHLERPMGDARGIFMIIFKKIDGQWKIVADMSC
ncbi:YybH family protein [Aureitalea marina]|uniref:DUF4440 domain-containing protein n=1 Tax=Aureitalea marina TaxID=930804 RepID=A0A2S7KLK7_9FLAO|nr:nuclear transport factor 2 family protein [Aureitalea marina]PQB03481.1 DUF4440 domain-containing protein [Aureitalea marina]